MSLQIVEWIYVDHRAVLGFEFEIAKVGRERGRQANGCSTPMSPCPSIGTITVGGLKYTYEGDVVDLMGLNSTLMAHNGGNRVGIRSHAAFEKRTFYELNPMWSCRSCNSARAWARLDRRICLVTTALKGLAAHNAIPSASTSSQRCAGMTPAGVVMLPGWYDKAFLARLNQLPDFEIVTQP